MYYDLLYFSCIKSVALKKIAVFLVGLFDPYVTFSAGCFQPSATDPSIESVSENENCDHHQYTLIFRGCSSCMVLIRVEFIQQVPVSLLFVKHNASHSR
jgi:hypothetical protein